MTCASPPVRTRCPHKASAVIGCSMACKLGALQTCSSRLPSTRNQREVKVMVAHPKSPVKAHAPLQQVVPHHHADDCSDLSKAANMQQLCLQLAACCQVAHVTASLALPRQSPRAILEVPLLHGWQTELHRHAWCHVARCVTRLASGVAKGL
eukprot:359441-Chlamydomonas_euryale.AAC.3